MNQLLILCITIPFSIGIVHAQHLEKEHESNEMQEEHLQHRLALATGTTFIPSGEFNAKTDGWLFTPTWGVDYEFWPKRSWGVGLFTDVELLNYVVSTSSTDKIKREIPVMISLMLLFKIHKGWGVQVGPAIEFEKSKNLSVFQLLVNYEFEIPGNWDITPSINYMNKANLYNSFAIMVSVGKKF